MTTIDNELESDLALLMLQYCDHPDLKILIPHWFKCEVSVNSISEVAHWFNRVTKHWYDSSARPPNPIPHDAAPKEAYDEVRKKVFGDAI